MRAKKEEEGEDGDDEGRGRDERFSIHPGPGELVHRGLHPPEVQSLPEIQKNKETLQCRLRGELKFLCYSPRLEVDLVSFKWHS